MGASDSFPVVRFDNGDHEMQRACANARANFRYFWRELSWERRRIVPALDLCCVKAPFTDGGKRVKCQTEVEHMWMSDVDFDGQSVHGVLINSPNWLKSVREGDAAHFPLGEISDWMYAIRGEVFGGYTVNLLRSRMGRSERRDHDGAWGLDFGDPANIRVVPAPDQGRGLLKRLFCKPTVADSLDPMGEAMAESLKQQLLRDPSLLTATDAKGWTALHREAAAGSSATVTVLLDAGAKTDALTHLGLTPIQLARSLGWTQIVALLAKR